MEGEASAALTPPASPKAPGRPARTDFGERLHPEREDYFLGGIWLSVMDRECAGGGSGTLY